MVNLLFIHIPRTGGTSIRRALSLPGKSDHRTAEELKKKLGSREFLRSYTYTVVRHPCSRIVSYYSGYRKSKETFPHFIDAILSKLQYPIETQFSRISVNGTLAVNRVLKFENLEEDWEKFACEFGLPLKLPHENSSKHGCWYDFYNQELADKVYQVYREDFDNLGYKRVYCNG